MQADSLGTRLEGERPMSDDPRELVKQYGDRLYNAIVKYLHAKHCQQPQAHAEGVCSASWINALASLKTVRDWERFDRWLLRIGRNEANRHLKLCIGKEKRDVEITDELPLAQLTDYYHSKDAAIDADRILTYVENISPELGSIFRLRLEHNLGFAEIGARLGITTVNVRNLYYRTLRKVKLKFNKTNDSERNDASGTQVKKGEES